MLVSDMIAEYNEGDAEEYTYVRSSDVFPCSTNSTSFYSTLRVYPLVPGALNILLNIKNSWNNIPENFMTRELGFNDIRTHHLNVSVATEAP